MTEQEAIDQIKAECHTGDVECDHAVADNVLCDFLNSLGHHELIAAWSQVNKWYA